MHQLSDYADRVLTAVEEIPPGHVQSYGDVAARVPGGGPRQVGTVMAHYGGTVCWWRVVRADGRPAAGLERRAGEHFRAEGTPLRDATPGGLRVDMREARWTGGD